MILQHGQKTIFSKNNVRSFPLVRGTKPHNVLSQSVTIHLHHTRLLRNNTNLIFYYFVFFFKSVTYISGEKASNHGRTEHQGWNKQLHNNFTQRSSSWIIVQLGAQISWLGPLNNTCYTQRDLVLKFTWGFHIYSFKFMCKTRKQQQEERGFVC